MCLTIWTQNDFQWKGLIDEFLSNHNHHQHQHYSQKINQPPWYVISKWLKIRSIFSLNLNPFWSILEAWLFSIFCKSPRKVLRSITSLKMWSSGVPQADYGTSLKLDSCSEKSPPSLLKSTLHSRNLATDACLYMYVCVCVCANLYVFVCICMCVYVLVCVCMYLYVCVCMWLLWWSVQRFTKGALVADQKWKGCHCFVFVLQIVYFHVIVFLLIFLLYLYSSPCGCGWPEVWG